jgi:hypothetical protein
MRMIAERRSKYATPTELVKRPIVRRYGVPELH